MVVVGKVRSAGCWRIGIEGLHVTVMALAVASKLKPHPTSLLFVHNLFQPPIRFAPAGNLLDGPSYIDRLR